MPLVTNVGAMHYEMKPDGHVVLLRLGPDTIELWISEALTADRHRRYKDRPDTIVGQMPNLRRSFVWTAK